MNKYSGLLIALFLAPAIALAGDQKNQPITPKHFSYKAQLNGGKSSLRRIELPRQVLEGMKRNDLGDLRIFNADGHIVPHQFKQGVIQGKIQKAKLAFYPFTKTQAADPGSIRIHIEQNSGKQNIAVNTQQAQQTKKKDNEFQYIIENKINQSQPQKQLCSLKLDWQQPSPNMILPLRIDTSHDLQNWTLLASNLSVSKLHYSGSQLLRSKIEIPCTTSRYLRLQWLKPKQNIHLTRIEGSYRQNGSKKMQWDSLGKPQITKQNEWLFEKTSVAPLSRLALIAPMDGLLYKGQLLSRNNPKSKWQVKQSFIQYRLKMQDLQLESNPVELTNGTDKYWKIKLTPESQFNPEQLPEIHVSRQQLQLIYLAQGSEPFTLAFGNSKIKPARDTGINQLIKTLQNTGSSPDTATPGTIKTNTEKVEISQDIPWRIISFWILLLFGTGIMGYMAYSLYQQMNNKE